jgi:hypothetical protein
MTNGQPEAELSSWKEIASYLDVSVKTAQLWELRRGMPVKRLRGGRGRVWALREELETWKAGSPPELELEPTPPRWNFRWIAAALIVLVIMVTAWRVSAGTGPLTSLALLPQGFVALDDKGKELWRYQFSQPLRIGSYSEDSQKNLLWAGDLDGDGVREVLFSPQVQHFSNDQILICFDSNGKQRWRFTGGKSIKTEAGDVYAPPYAVSTVAVLPPGKDGRRRIAVSSIHLIYFPTQVALLDHQGALLKEYWHSGHLQRSVVSQLNGRTVVLLGGVRNRTNEATLLALDPETMPGASKEDHANYQIAGFPPATEVRRLLFPRSCMNRAFEAMNITVRIRNTEDGLLVTVMERLMEERYPEILHHFSKELAYRSSDPSSQFAGEHGRLFQSGFLDHPLSDSEMRSLRPVDHSRTILGE